ncbi:MAG: hypothetical protein HeimC2_14510 [Candidatus Heimdallarchaeota archaeon LC_2]|nr:MAG: hypothetical protein HeimC2_14510 [Candidatus Heimdallarchaeota archaeon LC_2]
MLERTKDYITRTSHGGFVALSAQTASDMASWHDLNRNEYPELDGLSGRQIIEAVAEGRSNLVIYISNQIKGLPFFNKDTLNELVSSPSLILKEDGKYRVESTIKRLWIEYEYLRFLFDMEIQHYMTSIISYRDIGFGSQVSSNSGTNTDVDGMYSSNNEVSVSIREDVKAREAYGSYFKLTENQHLLEAEIDGKVVGDMTITELWDYMLYVYDTIGGEMKAMRLGDMVTVGGITVDRHHYNTITQYYADNFLFPVSALNNLVDYTEYPVQKMVDINVALPEEYVDNSVPHFIPMSTSYIDDEFYINGLLPPPEFNEMATDDENVLIMLFDTYSAKIARITMNGMITAYATAGGLKGWLFSAAQVPIITGAWQWSESYLPAWGHIKEKYRERGEARWGW